jgi:hypothetical protein
MSGSTPLRRLILRLLLVPVLAVGLFSIEGTAAPRVHAAPVDPATPGPQAIDGTAIVAAANAEVGTTRPTGWNQPGECFVSIRRWIAAAGGRLGSGGPTSSFTGVGALSVHAGIAAPGDIVQYTSTTAPDAWWNGVHTVLITAVHGDGTFQIVQSNTPAGSGLVTRVDRWTPRPPVGFTARWWRIGRPNVSGGVMLEVFHHANSGSGRTDAARVTPASVVWMGVTGLGPVAAGSGQFGLGDVNRDGVIDLVAVVTQGDPSGRSVIFAFSGPDYTRNIGAWVTPMGTFDSAAGEIAVGDVNRDGVADVVVLWGQGGSGRADLGILDGASGFSRFVHLAPTALGAHDGRRSDIALGDFLRRDGIIDLAVGFHEGTPTGRVDVFLLDATAGWQTAAGATLPLGEFADGNGQLLSGRFGGTTDSLAVVYTAGTPSGRPDLFVLEGLGTVRAAWTLPVGSAPTHQRTFVAR